MKDTKDQYSLSLSKQEKADYKCGKSFYLDPILDTYKKKIIEDPIVDKILEMIQKADTDRLDFGLKK